MGIRSIAPLFFAALLYACGGNVPKDVIPSIDSVTIRRVPVDPLKKDPSEVPVKDTVWGLLARARYNNAYCNGAPPPKEVLDQLKSPKLLKNSTIRFVLDKDTSKTATAKTDGRGVLRVMLDTGLWWCCLTRDADPATGINKNCPLLFRKRFCSVRIQKNESNVAELMFQLPCDPCDPEVKRRP